MRIGSGSRLERDLSRRSRVFELRTPCQDVEASDVVIQLGAGERAARVDEFDLADDALVALAAGNAKPGASGVGACGGGREGIAGRDQAIESLLDFEADLLRDFFLSQHDLAFSRARLAHACLVAAAIEQAPG